MTTSVDNRLRRLELATGGGECPECGFDGDWSKLRWDVEWDESGEGPQRNQHCSTCGRLWLVVVGWGPESSERR